jgi:hypothetical protein
MGGLRLPSLQFKTARRSITVECSVGKAESEPCSALHIRDHHLRQFCGTFNQGGTEARKKNEPAGIVPTLKSSGADSSALTAAFHKVVAATWFGHSERHVVVLAA